eukprot:742890-Hanusia_phi.AAC.1
MKAPGMPIAIPKMRPVCELELLVVEVAGLKVRPVCELELLVVEVAGLGTTLFTLAPEGEE